MRRTTGALIAIVLFVTISVSATADNSCEPFYQDGQLAGWWEKLGQPRYTGNPAHNDLIEYIGARLTEIMDEHPPQNISIQEQRQEFSKWDGWEPTIEGSRNSVYPVPYSGLTDSDGVTAEMFYDGRHGTLLQEFLLPRHFRNDVHGGKIVVVKVEPIPLGLALWMQSGSSRPRGKHFIPQSYQRAISLEVQVPSLRDAHLAGVQGLIVVLDDMELPVDQYVPFTRPLEEIPAVYVHGQRGKELIRKAMKGDTVTLSNNIGRLERTSTSHLIATLPATLENEECGVLPGAIVVNTHTDGPNRFEDNGVIALWSLMRYFADQDCRPRDLVFVFASAHFVHEAGSTDDVVRRNPGLFANTRAALTVEHLGAQCWSKNKDAPRKTEPGLFFCTAHDDSLNKMAKTVLKEHLRTDKQLQPVFLIKPKHFIYGEGPHLEREGIPTIAYLTNPAYLLSRENPEIHEEFFSPGLMCDQMHLFRDLIQEMMNLGPVGALQPR